MEATSFFRTAIFLSYLRIDSENLHNKSSSIISAKLIWQSTPPKTLKVYIVFVFPLTDSVVFSILSEGTTGSYAIDF